MFFFIVSSHLLYHVLPVIGAASTAALGSARSSPVHCGAWRHLIMCSIVCSCPHSQVSDDVSFHFFMDAWHLPSPTRSRFRVFQTPQGWSCPVVRHSSGVMPLSSHWVVWLPRLLHFFCHSVVLATVGVVSRALVVSRKLLLELNRFWVAECSWRRCRWPLACFVRSACVATALRISGGAMPERAPLCWYSWWCERNVPSFVQTLSILLLKVRSRNY